MLVVFKSENPENQSMTVIEVELYFYQDLNILLIFFSTCLELIFYEYRLGKAKNCWWIRMAVVNDDIRPAV
jgi:hypothetical protein